MFATNGNVYICNSQAVFIIHKFSCKKGKVKFLKNAESSIQGHMNRMSFCNYCLQRKLIKYGPVKIKIKCDIEKMSFCL